MVSGEYNLQDSWEECQISCQYLGGCNYWSYYSESVTDKSKHCELKHSDDEDADIEMEGAISGPKICPLFKSLIFTVKKWKWKNWPKTGNFWAILSINETKYGVKMKISAKNH